MSQEQRHIALWLSDGATRPAAASSNMAAWMCPCGRELPLLGRSGPTSGPTSASEVACPQCQRRYFVHCDGLSGGRVRMVEEID